jgi:RHS repeat-associated protein
MTDPLGNMTFYSYDPLGNRVSLTDPLGSITRFQYDTLDRLVGQTNALLGVISYTYDPFGRQLTVTDPNTNTTTYLYDVRGRLIRTTDPLGGTIRNGYDANNNRIATTNQLGHFTIFQYDPLNRLVRVTDPIGGLTQYIYDPAGNRLSLTDPNDNTTFDAYDPLNRVIAETNALGGVTLNDYSMLGGPSCCSPTPGSSLLTRQQDANGNVTFYHYDELDRRVQVVRKNSDFNDVINPTDAVTTTAYDPVGNITSVTDPNGNTTTSVYDPDNRQISLVDAAGDTTLTTYDPDGNVATVTMPNLNTKTNIYDTLHRVIAVYDEVGVVRSTVYDPNGNVTASSDGLGDTTRYFYDALNRQVESIDALGHGSTNAYDADSNVISVTDRNGHVTQYAYDFLDRKVSMTDALGHVTITQYDADSNVSTITDANGHTTRYAYDALNRRTAETFPDTPPNTRTNIYDAVGNLIQRIDQKGQVTTYSYNRLYYLLNRAYSPSGANDSFTYDNGGRVLSANRNGWVDTFSYDGANRVLSTLENGRSLGYSYNIPGRVQTNTQPSGRALIYTYDARSRLSIIEDGTPNPPIVTYTYDEADRVIGRDYRNGTTTTYTYNSNNWMLTLEHVNGVALIAGFNYAYDNEGNKLSEQKLHNAADSETYLYDALDRITNYDVGMLSGPIIPAPVISRTWNLDPVGNWNGVTNNGVPNLRTHGPSNELLTDDAQFYAYDANGNLSQDTSYNYLYDEENRVTQVQRRSDAAIVGQYAYDALGRRVVKIANPAGASFTTDYYYDGARVIEEQTTGGATIATYSYGNYVDEVLTMDRGGNTYYYHQNALATPHALTDSGANVVERYTYDVYGSVSVLDAAYVLLPLNPWGTPHSAVGNPWLFTGRQLDEETGLYFYRARYYDSLKGRFLERDPLGYIDGMNLYEYVRSRPTRFTDPSGRRIVCGGLSGFAAYAIAGSGSVSVCTDNCNPSRTAIVVCFGLGGGVGASIGGGGTVGQGCLSAGWSTQITIQGAGGIGGLSGSASLTDPDVPVSGGGSIGPGGGFTVTIERCYTWLVVPGANVPPRRPMAPDHPPLPPAAPCCQCKNYGVKTRCTPGACGWFTNFTCLCGKGVNSNDTGPCTGGVDCKK